MATGNLKWYGRRNMIQIRKASASGIRKALAFYHLQLKRKIGRQGSESNRSRPGQPPRKQSGFLQKSIYTHFDEQTMTGYVALDEAAGYGNVLEKGTKDGRIKPRPWQMTTFFENRAKIAKLVGGG